MSNRSAVLAALAAICALSAAPARSADSPPAAPQGPQPDYHPSLADLMTSAVQPRHIKIGVAGKARNWAYLTYESSEMRNAFTRIARTIPAYRQNKLADLFASGVVPALDELDAAIKVKDAAKFDTAYVHVTEACNNCHMSLDHAYVVIRAPLTSPYPDQDLRGR